MIGYRIITLRDGDREHEYAVNWEGQGVFYRRSDGSWGQMAGTCQTPTFDDPRAFRRWLGRNFEGVRGRLIDTRNWD